MRRAWRDVEQKILLRGESLIRSMLAFLDLDAVDYLTRPARREIYCQHLIQARFGGILTHDNVRVSVAYLLMEWIMP